jgi:hypothetical protein
MGILVAREFFSKDLFSTPFLQQNLEKNSQKFDAFFGEKNNSL